jgi:hypothetical protein
MIRKLILLLIPLSMLTAAPDQSKTKVQTNGKPSKFNPKRHSKPRKQKQFKVRHGKIKH